MIEKVLKILFAVTLLVPIGFVHYAKERANDIYSIAYINIPYTKGSIIVELLPDFIQLKRITNLKSSGISFTHIPRTNPIIPVFRSSLKAPSKSTLEWDWPIVTAIVSLSSLAVLSWYLAFLFRNRKSLSSSKIQS